MLESGRRSAEHTSTRFPEPLVIPVVAGTRRSLSALVACTAEALIDLDAVPLNRHDAFQHQGHRGEGLRPFVQVGMDVNGTFRRIDRLST